MSAERLSLKESEMVSPSRQDLAENYHSLSEEAKIKYDVGRLCAEIGSGRAMGSAKVSQELGRQGNIVHEESTNYWVGQTNTQEQTEQGIDQYSIAIRRSTSADMGRPGGYVEVTFDTTGNIKTAYTYVSQNNKTEQYFLEPRDAINFAAEAVSVVGYQNAQDAERQGARAA